jgi:hypothetical protein
MVVSSQRNLRNKLLPFFPRMVDMDIAGSGNLLRNKVLNDNNEREAFIYRYEYNRYRYSSTSIMITWD